MIIEMMYTISIAIPVIMSALGAGIGQGLIGMKSIEALHIQPSASAEIRKVSTIGLSFTETAAILGLVLSIMLYIDTTIPISFYDAALGRIGISLAIGLSGFIAGITSSWPAQAACLSVAKQPFFSNKILQLMLLTQTVISTPNIFGFLIALFIKAQIPFVSNTNQGLRLLAAGLSIGLGSIGPCIGLSAFAAAACTAIGINRKSYSKILTFTFISEAIIETPVLFSFIISLLILSIKVNPEASIVQGIAFIAAAICMGLSTVGTGISTGITGAAACNQIGIKPEEYSTISNISLFSLAMIDTCAIYGFIISIMLIYSL